MAKWRDNRWNFKTKTEVLLEIVFTLNTFLFISAHIIKEFP